MPASARNAKGSLALVMLVALSVAAMAADTSRALLARVSAVARRHRRRRHDPRRCRNQAVSSARRSRHDD